MPKKRKISKTKKPRKVGKARKNMTWEASIKEVLEEKAAPMHYQVIAKQIGKRDLQELGANAPYAVVATISLSMKTKKKKSPFVRTERGYYALRSALSSPADAVESDEQMGQLITSYGLHWQKDRISWRSAEPQILGRSSAGGTPVDFHGQHGVYILYDAVYRPVYVGQSGKSIGNRLKKHNTGWLQGRWQSFSWFGLLKVEADGTLGEAASLSGNASILAKILEAVLIEVAEPPLNRKRGKGLGGTEYLQPEDLEDSEDSEDPEDSED